MSGKAEWIRRLDWLIAVRKSVVVDNPYAIRAAGEWLRIWRKGLD